MSINLSDAVKTEIGKAFHRAITWNRGNTRPLWHRIGREMQEHHIARAMIVVEAYEKAKQAEAEEQAQLLKLEQERDAREVQEKLEQARERLLSFSQEDQPA